VQPDHARTQAGSPTSSLCSVPRSSLTEVVKPPWFKVPAPGGPRYRELQSLIKAENLNTVCQEAACPNIGECWQRGTATFMILGDTCTRRCGFLQRAQRQADMERPARTGRASAGRSRAWACATP